VHQLRQTTDFLAFTGAEDLGEHAHGFFTLPSAPQGSTVGSVGTGGPSVGRTVGRSDGGTGGQSGLSGPAGLLGVAVPRHGRTATPTPTGR